MFLIVGLGNPEENYANTRHNMGFNCINELAKKYNIDVTREKFNGLYGCGSIDGQKVVLLKPQTYMNNSGECIYEFMNFYKLENSNILIIYDDMDIQPGNIRIREKGSPGNHNGVKSVSKFLKTEEFTRIRIGIGKPTEEENVIEYVIGQMPKEMHKVLETGIEKAVDATLLIIQGDVAKAMNKYN